MRSLQRWAFLLAVMVLAGCGDSKGKVKGQVLENGEPKSFGGAQVAIQLTFVKPDGGLDDTKSYTAVVGGDGSFEVIASSGELPVGKYQVALQIAGGNPKYKHLAPPQSPIRREIKSGDNMLTIDVAKPEG